MTRENVKVPAVGHIPASAVKENIVEATCLLGGSYDNVIYCSVCNVEVARENVKISAVGHVEVVDDAVAPTCTSTGLTEGKHCSVCGEVLIAQTEIPAVGHIPASVVKENVVEATCLLGGSYDNVIYCGSCNEELSRETITSPALGHVEVVDDAFAPTCTSIGLTEGKHCSVCGEVLIAQTEIPALGHTPAVAVKENIVESTCSIEGGFDNVVYCSTCNMELSRERVYIPKLEHNYQNGLCTVCGVASTEYFTFTLLLNGTYRVSVKNIRNLPNELVIPSEYNGKSVTSIGNSAFYGCSSLTSVVIPDSVIYIGDSAFKDCSNLTSVIIGDSVTSIGDSAFIACDSLTSVVIPDSVTYIGDSAFKDCSNLTSVIIGDSVTSIGDSAFKDCSNLTSVVIPDSVTSIDSYAFQYCCKLVEVINKSSHITVTKGNSSNGYVAYYALAVYKSDDSYVSRISNDNGYIVYTEGEEKILVGYSGTETDLILPSYITKINKYAFYNCSNLTSVVIGGSVTSIGDYAFDDCYKLVEVVNKSSHITVKKGNFSNGYVGYFALSVSNCDDSYVRKISNDNGYIVYTEGEEKILLGYNGTESDLILPSYITQIYNRAFYGCESLISVVIPDSVNYIGGSAFYSCNNLTSVVIGKSVTSIGNSAFYGCNNLTSVVIPDSVTSIGAYAFYGCSSLTSVVIPDSVTYIGDSAFYSCYNLTSVVIPNSVTYIGDSAFYGCYRLQYNEEDELCYLGNNSNPYLYLAAVANQGITTVNINANCKHIASSVFYGCSSLTSVVIPDSVTSISSVMFRNCTSLTSVKMGASVTSIGDSAFMGCSSLTSIEIPNSVISIGHNVFLDCSNLIEITLPFIGSDADDEFGYIGYVFGAYSHYGNNNYVPKTLTKVTVFGGEIGSSAFAGCSNIVSIILLDSVTSISDSAFENCSSLTSLVIGNSVDFIDDSAFDGCNNLQYNVEENLCYLGNADNPYLYLLGTTTKDITFANINDNCKMINSASFEGCTSLTSVSIPTSVKYIPYALLADSNNLTEITIPYVANDHFGYIFGTWSVGNNYDYVPKSLTKVTVLGGEIGSRAFENCSNIVSISLSDSVTYIGDSAFKGCSSLTSIEIPDSVTSIGSSAFEECSSLTSVVIGDSVNYIGGAVFYGCSSLTSVVIGDSVTSIGGLAFYGCSSLTSVVIGDSVTSIDDLAFDGCESIKDIYITDLTAWYNLLGVANLMNYGSSSKNLYLNNELVTEVIIPNSITSISESLFDGCSSLTLVEIPNSITSIGECAFKGCSSLTSVVVPNSVTSIGRGAFAGCNGLQEIALPFVGSDINGVYSASFHYIFNVYDYNWTMLKTLKQVTITGGQIASRAFLSCSSIVSITLPDSATAIGSYAFEDCSSLTSVEIPNSVTSIGECAFKDCSSLTSVVVPNSVTSIGKWAFAGCCSLQEITLPFVGSDINGTISKEIDYIFREYHLEIPKTLKKVTINGGIIWTGSFAYCDELISLVIGDSVTTIEERAFGECNKLVSVVIGSSVTSIGEGAFTGCSTIIEVVNRSPYFTITKRSEANGRLGYFAKYVSNCDSSYVSKISKEGEFYIYTDVNEKILVGYAGREKDVIIPDGITRINSYVFKNCSDLTSIAIPNSVTSIGALAFDGCTGLTSLVISEYVTSIDYGAFSNCSGLTSVVIGDSVTLIGSKAFCGCSSLTSVVIGDSVTSIGERAFDDCSSLTSVVIPNSVTSIGDYAFYGCSSLEEIILPFVGQSVDGFIDLHFGSIFGAPSYDRNKDFVPATLRKVTVLGGKIANSAFEGCDSLISVILGESVTSIGDRAFYGCTSLTSIAILNSAIKIGNMAFEGCNLEENVVTVEDGLRYLGNKDNPYLWLIDVENKDITVITVNENCKNIALGALKECTNLIEITVPFVGETLDGTGNTHFGYIFGANNSSCVPASLKKVTILGGSISPNAFNYCRGLTSVVIGDGVTSIGYSVFEYCSSLTSVVIGDGVTSIGSYAFNKCSSLTSVVIGDGVTSIDSYAFNKCSSLTSVVIGDGVTSIGTYAFNECSSLTSVVIPNSVTSIGTYAFNECGSLTEVNYLGTIDEWAQIEFGSYANPLSYTKQLKINGEVVTEVNLTTAAKVSASAFYNYSGLTSVVIGDSVTSIGNYAFYNCNSLTSVVIGDSVTSIGNYAFDSCNSLTAVVIGNGVTSIGNYAFDSCDSLTSIEIPDSVTSIGEYAFFSCSRLTLVVIGNGVTSIGNYAFDYCYKLVEVINKSSHITVTKGSYSNGYLGCYALSVFNCDDSYVSRISNDNGYIVCTEGEEKILVGYFGSETNLVLPSYITKINQYAFYSCSNLTSVVIPNSVTSIGKYAFRGCRKLTSVVIPNSVTSIGNGAFYNCNGLNAVVIGNGVISIGDSAFYGCSSLTSVVIGNSVKSIGYGAFQACRKLTSVVICDSVRSIGPSAFSGCFKLVEVINKSSHITVSKGSHLDGYVAYYALSVSNRDDSYVSKLFTDENGYITYTDGSEIILIDYIGSETNLVLPSNITKIYEYAFQGCSSLTSVVIPNSVTSIGNYAFYGCSKLTSVVIPNSVTSIGNYAFYGCSKLTSVVIPNSVTSIGNDAFEYCNSLTSIEIPDSVTSIGMGAFYGCSSLTEVNYLGTIDQWAEIEFGSYNANPIYYAKQLKINGEVVTEVNLTTATRVSALAFYNCSSLTSVVIGDSVTSIGSAAFYGCSSLTAVVIGASVEYIGGSVFSECTRLNNVSFSDDSTWFVTTNSNDWINKVAGNKVSVEDASKNKTYFIYTYGSYYWYKAE